MVVVLLEGKLSFAPISQMMHCSALQVPTLAWERERERERVWYLHCTACTHGAISTCVVENVKLAKASITWNQECRMTSAVATTRLLLYISRTGLVKLLPFTSTTKGRFVVTALFNNARGFHQAPCLALPGLLPMENSTEEGRINHLLEEGRTHA